MIVNPTLEALSEIVDIRFNIVIAVSKRARDIQAGSTTYYDGEEKNPITIATKEIDLGVIKCTTFNSYGE